MILHQHATRFAQRSRAVIGQKSAIVGAGFNAVDVSGLPGRLPKFGGRFQTLPHALARFANRLFIRYIVADGVYDFIEFAIGHRPAPFVNSFCSVLRARCTVTATTICDIPINFEISGLV